MNEIQQRLKSAGFSWEAETIGDQAKATIWRTDDGRRHTGRGRSIEEALTAAAQQACRDRRKAGMETCPNERSTRCLQSRSQ